MSNFRDVVLSNLPVEWPFLEEASGLGSAPMSDAVAISVRSDLDDFLARLMPAISADGVAIAFKEEDQFVCRAAQGRAPRVGSLIEPGVGLCGKCIQQRRTVIEQDLEGELRSVMATPIYVGPRMAGVIGAFSTKEHGFQELDIEMVVAIASHLGEFERGGMMKFGDTGSDGPEGESEMDSAQDYLARIHEELYPTKGEPV